MRQLLQLVLVALALATVLTTSHALLRAAASHPPFEFIWLLHVCAALVLYAAVFFVYSIILKYFDLSVLYPTYTGLSILGVFLIGVLYFGEHFTLQKIIGVIAIIIGIGLLAG